MSGRAGWRDALLPDTTTGQAPALVSSGRKIEMTSAADSDSGSGAVVSDGLLCCDKATFDEVEYIIELERLCQDFRKCRGTVLVGVEAFDIGCHRDEERRMATDIACHEFAHHIDAIEFRHMEIEKGDVVAAAGQQLERLTSVMGDPDLMAARLQQHFQDVLGDGGILRDQDLRLTNMPCPAGFVGNRKNQDTPHTQTNGVSLANSFRPVINRKTVMINCPSCSQFAAKMLNKDLMTGTKCTICGGLRFIRTIACVFVRPAYRDGLD